MKKSILRYWKNTKKNYTCYIYFSLYTKKNVFFFCILSLISKLSLALDVRRSLPLNRLTLPLFVIVYTLCVWCILSSVSFILVLFLLLLFLCVFFFCACLCLLFSDCLCLPACRGCFVFIIVLYVFITSCGSWFFDVFSLLLHVFIKTIYKI